MHKKYYLKTENTNELKGPLIEKAQKLALVYANKYGGCCPATFAVIAETLGMEGSSEIFKATIGLSGGIADLGVGACGAMAASAIVIGLKLGITPEKLDTDPKHELVHKTYDIVEQVARKFIDKFGGITCRAVQMSIFGKSYDLRRPEIHEEFARTVWPQECAKNVIANAAVWTVEEIFKLNRDISFRKSVRDTCSE